MLWSTSTRYISIEQGVIFQRRRPRAWWQRVAVSLGVFSESEAYLVMRQRERKHDGCKDISRVASAGGHTNQLPIQEVAAAAHLM